MHFKYVVLSKYLHELGKCVLHASHVFFQEMKYQKSGNESCEGYIEQ